MTYDFNGYEGNAIRRGSPDDIARDKAELKVVDEGCDLSPTSEGTKIFNSSGGIDMTKLVPNV